MTEIHKTTLDKARPDSVDALQGEMLCLDAEVNCLNEVEEAIRTVIDILLDQGLSSVTIGDDGSLTWGASVDSAFCAAEPAE